MVITRNDRTATAPQIQQAVFRREIPQGNVANPDSESNPRASPPTFRECRPHCLFQISPVCRTVSQSWTGVPILGISKGVGPWKSVSGRCEKIVAYSSMAFEIQVAELKVLPSKAKLISVTNSDIVEGHVETPDVAQSLVARLSEETSH